MTATAVPEHHAATGWARHTVGHDSAEQEAFSTDIAGASGRAPRSW
jgi:hypothetical protein